jgi:hypothetical protein
MKEPYVTHGIALLTYLLTYLHGLGITQAPRR